MLYFDNASTTRISKNSLDAYNRASEQFFNPSALYKESIESMKIIEDAREFFLSKLNGKKGSTIIFTGSATESNNSVLNSCITRKDKKYLIGGGEHSSIYSHAKKLIENGYNIQFIPIKNNGGIDIEALKSMLDEDVAFVSIMHVSNETGAINDIAEIARIIKECNNKILFHVDGVQALGKLNINLEELGVDFYTLSAHKINGPKGIGALYIANKNKFKPLLLGGEQEMGLRASTENIPAIAAFKASLNDLKITDYSEHKKEILNNLSGDYVIVSDDNCVDNIISICFASVRGETLLHMMEDKGYLIGTGSACNSKAGYNRVLSQIVPTKYLSGAVRLSFDSSVGLADCKNIAIELSNAAKLYISKTK